MKRVSFIDHAVIAPDLGKQKKENLTAFVFDNNYPCYLIASVERLQRDTISSNLVVRADPKGRASIQAYGVPAIRNSLERPDHLVSCPEKPVISASVEIFEPFESVARRVRSKSDDV